MAVSVMAEVQFAVLGPVEAHRGGVPLDLGRPKQRAVLALLLVEPGRPVSMDRLLDAVWGEAASESNRSSVHTYISNLRAALKAPIERTGGGYQIGVDPHNVDAVVFEESLAEARRLVATDPTAASESLRAALALWRGRPYADIIDAPGLEVEARRLEELRLAAVELRIDADLAAGRHESIIAEVGALAEEYQERERFRAQHMIALYRSGRQTEALRAYRRTEEYLATQLGLEPSQELRDLELAILQQDDDLRRGPGRTTTERLAFLVTDIEDSTGAWDRYPQNMAEALATHDAILSTAIEQHGGRIFKHTGDGVLAAFPDVSAAAGAAEAAQRGLASADWREVGGIKVKMAIDIGDAEARGGDFYGPPVNRAARLTSAAHGGQVLVSAAAQAEISSAGPVGMQIRHMGEHVLRGFSASERIGQLVFVGLPADFPELRIDRDIPLGDGQATFSLPGYELRERVGEGAFGVVYRAYQPSVGREVAVKIIRPELCSHPSFIHRFEAEARTIARLAHPRIVPLIDFWRDADGAYLVLQLLPAGSLKELMIEGSVDRSLARHVLRHVGEALDHAHAMGTVHGDLKPANVLLDGSNNAYLSDFGIAARLLDPDLVASISVAPEYRAPEEAAHGPSQAADLFALGMIARGMIDDPAADAVLARATATNPGDRHPDAATFLSELGEVLGEEPLEVPRPAVSRNPYKGLRAFDESDAADFYGRNDLIATLLTALERNRLLTVVGPSGSGKSSVVQAGLLPRLVSDRPTDQWLTVMMTPGPHPMESLAEALQTIASNTTEPGILLESGDLVATVEPLVGDGDGKLLLLIDQLEELYTLVDDDDRRRAFIDCLVNAAADEDSRVRLVATLRADYYDRPLQHPELGRLVRDGLVTVLRPTPEELVEMITAPAQAVGLRWEPGLPHRISRDISDEPGALPLLQYALTELVERRTGDLLTSHDYDRIGGVAGALSTRAETLFDSLTEDEQEAARQVFLRLVQVDENTDDTRRRVRRMELESLGLDRGRLDSVLESFTSERLLLADRDPLTRGPTIEVAHEALLREWPRLRGWIEDEREVLILSRRFRAALSDWEQSDEDDDYLITGSRLAPFLDWGEIASLSADERRFFNESRRRDMEEQEARHRRRRIQLSVLGLAALIATVLAIWALGERNRAAEEAQRAETESEQRLAAQQEAEEQRSEAETQAQLAERNAEIARSRELAASAISVLDDDPTLSKLLALAAAEIADPPLESISALHRAIAADRVVSRYGWPEGTTAPWEMWTHLHPSGKRLVAAGIDGIPSTHMEVVEIASGDVLWSWSVEQPQVGIERPRFVDDGRLIVAETLWETRNREGPAPNTSELGVFVFDADTGEMVDKYDTGTCGATVRAASDTHLAVASVAEDAPGCYFLGSEAVRHPLELIDLRSGERQLLAPNSRRGRGEATLDGGAAFSGDGRLLAFDDVESGLVVLVDVATGERISELDLADDSQSDSYVRLLDHDGSLLVYGTTPIRVIDVTTGEVLTEIHTPSQDSYVEVTDDSLLATAFDGVLRTYDLRTGQEQLSVAGVGAGAVSFSPDEDLVLVSDQVRGASLVDIGTRGEVLAVETCPGFNLGGSLDASGTLASYMTICETEVDGRTQTTHVVDTATGEMVYTLWGGKGQEQTISPDGTKFVRHEGEALLFRPARVYDLGTGEELFVLEGVCEWDGSQDTQLRASLDEELCFNREAPPFASIFHRFAWSPDGSMLAGVDQRVSGTGAPVMVWDAATGELLFYELGNTSLSHHADAEFTPDSSAMVSSYWNPALRRFSTDTWELESEVGYPPELTGAGHLNFVGYDEDGSHLMVIAGIRMGTDVAIHWLDAETLELDFSLTSVHDAGVRATALNDDRSRLATASSDGVIRVWDTNNGELLHEAALAEVVLQGVAFIDDDHLAVTPQGGGLWVITVDNDELLDLARDSLTRGFTPVECDKFGFDVECPTLETLRHPG